MDIVTEIPFVNWQHFLRRFQWKQGEHLTLVGPTGGGKTTLAMEILPRRDHTVVFATKRRDPLISALKGKGYETSKEFLGNYQIQPKVVLQPSLSKGIKSLDSQRQEFQRALFLAFQQGGWTVYLDEAQYVCEYLKLAQDCELLLRQGRSLGVTVVAGTQRPVNIPLAFYDQATHLFFWRDNDEVNLKRIGGLGGMSSRVIREAVSMLDLHQVLYLNTRTGYMVKTKVSQ